MPRWIAWAVFASAFCLLAVGAGRPRITSVWVDPIAHIEAQDEATYGASAFEVARGGDWMTPMFLQRIAFHKPPLLYWLQAIFSKMLGLNAWALRLPSLLAGGAAAALVFVWVARTGLGTTAGLASALLLCSSHLFFVMSRVGMMDILLTACIVTAVFALDAKVATTRSAIVFGVAAGAAILTKSIAGLPPLLILGAWLVVDWKRPSWNWLGVAAVSCCAIALPWFAYQLLTHREWFWTEHVLGEILGWGLTPPRQTTGDSRLAFYAARLLLDPILLGLAVIGLFRRPSKLVVVWGAVGLGVVAAFQYRGATYLLPVLPALAILAAKSMPPRWLMTCAVAAFCVKAALGSERWGLPYKPEFESPVAATLDRYAAMNRGNELWFVQVEDQFYSAVLRIPKVRYMYVSPGANPSQFKMDFFSLGIMLHGADFERLHDLRPGYEAKLKAWGQTTGDPLGTVVFSESQPELDALIRAHPEVDMLAPRVVATIDAGAHDLSEAGGGNLLLLSREVVQRAAASP